MKIVIESLDNGYLVTTANHEASLDETRIGVVEDDFESEASSMRRLLWVIADVIDPNVFSKHNEEKLRVILVNQDDEEIEPRRYRS